MDLKVSASYSKCRRAPEKATDDLFGSDEDSYQNRNRGRWSERFLYTFLAFGASIQGFSQLRRVLVVDGTHLTGKYKGVLFTASGQDGNFQVLPLAFAVVDRENDDSWTWFFEKLERIIADSNTLTIISDRCQSIYVAKKRVFPRAHHGACIVHLARNVNAKFHNKGLAKLVTNAAYAYTADSFRTISGQIRGKNIECAKWLEKIGTAHWSRAYFQGDHYNLMTSNIAESLNKALWKCRASPIVELLKFIRAMLTRWFSARRKKSATHNGLVTPEVDKEMAKSWSQVRGNKVATVETFYYEIVGGFTRKHQVLLDLNKCTCKQYDRLKIPCGHAMLAANYQGIPPTTLVVEYYKTTTWAATYAGVINPEVHPNDIGMADEFVKRDLLPPKSRRPSGRPIKTSIPSGVQDVQDAT
ncbi:PREDICTED: uncharacterized protein LOC104715176 [Camelina sativa]|uniref:Uncharacterized protein LOC104715175 n=1 Tax=Camelina sativa TaxID=90675 RepID=A0ABM0TT38_CAMSA|nr:PREDICTED: uncharacterized protein LOC104715175 [Camelina sativa]XP_010430914.1 PREDICTED: uncharacterized protein LOC104715176 [Camelina sativa]